MTPNEIEDVVRQVTYKDWIFVTFPAEEGLKVKATFIAPDLKTGVQAVQKSRAWMLTTKMTTTEIVWTLLKLVKSAEEHELLENFRYKKVPVGNPHLNVEVLAKIAGKLENLDLRKDVS